MYYIGIDLGGTNTAIGVVDVDGTLVYKNSKPTLKNGSYQELIYDMANFAKIVVEESGLSMEDIHSIGIGSPGTPDTENGILIYSNNIKMENVPIRAEMQKHINLPVYLDNDANCAALAESVAGAAKDATCSVTITLGTGVGSGIVLNGRIYNGFNHAAAEMGHMLLKYRGRKCTCGRKGCLEAYASATALIGQIKAEIKKNKNSGLYQKVMLHKKVTPKLAFEAAKEGDLAAIRVIDQYLDYLAEGIISIVNAFQPEKIVIGGGVSAQGEFLTNRLEDKIKKGVFCKEVPVGNVVIAALGNDAGIVGAAMLGKNKNA